MYDHLDPFYLSTAPHKQKRRNNVRGDRSTIYDRNEENHVEPFSALSNFDVIMENEPVRAVILDRLDNNGFHTFLRDYRCETGMDTDSYETGNQFYKYSLLMHCIKIKSPAKFLLNEQYVFVGGNISFLCVLSCSSEEASSTWLWIKWFVKQN